MTTTPKTLRQVITMLEEAARLYGDDAPFGVTMPAHDYWRTTLVKSPSIVEVAPIKHSGYHDSLVLDDAERDEETATAVLLRCE